MGKFTLYEAVSRINEVLDIKEEEFIRECAEEADKEMLLEAFAETKRIKALQAQDSLTDEEKEELKKLKSSRAKKRLALAAGGALALAGGAGLMYTHGKKVQANQNVLPQDIPTQGASTQNAPTQTAAAAPNTGNATAQTQSNSVSATAGAAPKKVPNSAKSKTGKKVLNINAAKLTGYMNEYNRLHKLWEKAIAKKNNPSEIKSINKSFSKLLRNARDNGIDALDKLEAERLGKEVKKRDNSVQRAYRMY